MPRGTPLDLVNREFERLTVKEKTPLRYKSGGVIWRCECKCGNRSVYVSASNLTSDKQTSCGCFWKERLIEAHTTHGLTHTPLYRRYRSFLANAKGQVCARWRGKNGIVNFYADMGEPPEGAWIQRHDPDKPFSPKNCYWGTRSETLRRANGRLLTYKSEARCITEWAEILGVSRQCVQQGGERYLARQLAKLEQLEQAA